MLHSHFSSFRPQGGLSVTKISINSEKILKKRKKLKIYSFFKILLLRFSEAEEKHRRRGR